jgi:hypothetical protein
MARRKSRKVLEAEQFHATVVWLMSLSGAEWSPWEEGWLHDEGRRPIGYVYTKTEREKLNQLIAVARPFTHYSYYSVQELLQLADKYRADYKYYEDEEFLDELKKSGTTELRLRQIDRLATLIRRSEPLTRDEEVEEVLRQTRLHDASVVEVDEFTAFRNVA